MANTTLNPADKSATATLSGGNLTVSFSGGAVGVRAIAGMTAGKFYFEVLCTAVTGTICLIGVANASATFGNVNGNTNGNAAGATANGGTIAANNSTVFLNALGTFTNGNIIGVAVDLDNRLLWARKAPAGNWNGNAAYAPGGTGGASVAAISSGSIPVHPVIGVSASPTAIFTANYGDSAFSGAVPSGYTSGWPTVAPVVPAAGSVMVSVIY